MGPKGQEVPDLFDEDNSNQDVKAEDTTDLFDNSQPAKKADDFDIFGDEAPKDKKTKEPDIDIFNDEFGEKKDNQPLQSDFDLFGDHDGRDQNKPEKDDMDFFENFGAKEISNDDFLIGEKPAESAEEKLLFGEEEKEEFDEGYYTSLFTESAPQKPRVEAPGINLSSLYKATSSPSEPSGPPPAPKPVEKFIPEVAKQGRSFWDSTPPQNPQYYPNTTQTSSSSSQYKPQPPIENLYAPSATSIFTNSNPKPPQTSGRQQSYFESRKQAEKEEPTSFFSKLKISNLLSKFA